MKACHALVGLRDDHALCLPTGTARQPAPAQSGAVAIMFCVTLLVIFGIFGMTFDLARLYNRRIEMQTLADSVALAAAHELNGTAQGLANALDKANQAAVKLKYDYGISTVSWSNSAIKFGASPRQQDAWLDAGAAAASPQGLLYAKVDTTDLASPQGTIVTWFIRILPDGPTSATANGRAIAGPSMINVTPFAICAMSQIAGEKRTNPGSAGPPVALPKDELLEYGFRRGVGYDLMRLNPNATTPENFLVNPIAPPGTTGVAADMTTAAVEPFLCAGTMAMPRVTGGTITVASQFPLASLFDRFNSRFDDYTSGNCDPWAAPPDINVKSYDKNVAANIPWMSPANPQQVAEWTTAGSKLRTLADLLPSGTSTADQQGVLWAFAKAVPFSSYVAGQPEPTSGYTTFSTTDWPSLYDPGRPTALGTYNTGTATPYTTLLTSTAPAIAHRPGIKFRRVLNVPLLACPVGGSSASVLAVGKFFMTVPANATHLYAEFAGVASESSLATKVELHP